MRAATGANAYLRGDGLIQAADTPQGPQGQGFVDKIETLVEGLAALGGSSGVLPC
ncbi:MAG: hypothetical protein ACK5RA_04215 [Cyanobacteriota bacterium]